MTHLGQQLNGLSESTNTSCPRTADAHHTPDPGAHRDKPGGVTSSTPLRTGSCSLPYLSESPVPAGHR